MKDFLCIGSTSVDLFLKDDKFEKDLSGFVMGNKYDVSDYFIRIGGSAYNTASFFSGLGCKTGLMTCVSDKYYGKLICSKVRKQKNLTAKLVEVNKHIKTSFSVILLSKTNERIILKNSAFARGFHFRENALKQYMAICLSSLNGRGDVWEKVFRHVGKTNKFLSINPGAKDFDFLKNNLEYLRLVDVFVLNIDEASIFSGISKKEVFKILNYFSMLFDGVFIMTMGKKGSYVCCKDEKYMCGIYEGQDVKDMTGAGDAFYSGFVLAYYLYMDIEFALRIGNMNAYECVGEIGASESLLTFKKYLSSFWDDKFDKLKIERIYE